MSLAACTAFYAQQRPLNSPINQKGIHQGSGDVITPTSGIDRPEDAGTRMHPFFKIYVPAGRAGQLGFAEEKVHPEGTPISGYYAETPQSLACLYGVTAWTAGCSPSTLPNTAHATGGSKAIAVVEAFDYPTALADLTKYSAEFGLPAPVGTGTHANFTTVYATGTNPGPDPACAADGGWNCWTPESALDVDMAHAMAPAAHIYLVEAAGETTAELYAAIAKAASLVAAAGGGEVSMSFGSPEFASETSLDSTFTGANVVFFAAAGDHEGVYYPSASPDVVSVGGTTISRNYSNGLDIEAEITWEDGGGGYSEYEKEPAFQDVVFGTGTDYTRAVPDVAAVGNPRTGVWIYDSYDNASPWNIVGGTSVAAPVFAGAVNAAGQFSVSTAAEHTLLYSNFFNDPVSGWGINGNLRDITYGSCGYYEGWYGVSGWDPCTGLGSPYGTAGK